ncbi:MAG: asparagine synthase (glutamine-hydrolyzing) [Ardenticatenaceae bacterium]
MCGICGIWNYKTKEPVPPDLLREMRDRMTHRGPDDSGLHFDDAAGVGLGFRRLSIIDLSPAGHQPMSNEDGTVWLVFNGEIYNFLDLRPQLEAKGHVFRSRTDSEVIIHQYEERGIEWLNDLNGMFGLGLWDARKQRMVLARDRIGKKPLYYYDDGKRLLFASELKAILADPSVPRTLNYTALGEYLALGYVSAPKTIFEGIRKLPPGHYMLFEKENFNVQRYWDWLPAFQKGPNHTRSEAQWVEEVRELLKTVVRDRLISDVPLGAFLSGGVDSSAVVASMAELSEHPVKTFSIGFHNEKYNELQYARQVAERFGTEHHEYIVEPESLRDLAPRLVQQFDEPFGDSSAVPTYYVSKMAREHVTVCLSGDGGDETMAGYFRYAQAIRETKVDRLPRVLRQALFGLPARLIPVGMKGQRFAERMTKKREQRYSSAIRYLRERQITSLLTTQATQQLTKNGLKCVEQAFNRSVELDFLSRLQYVDSATYLPEDILAKVDRTSMANSLEVRCPLLDYRFMELMATVPPSLRLQNGQGKYLFKKSMRNWLPDKILDRRKMGFAVPLREWFRDEMNDYAAEVLLDRQTLQRGLWQPEEVQTLLSQHRGGAYALETTIWSLLIFEMWSDTYL